MAAKRGARRQVLGSAGNVVAGVVVERVGTATAAPEEGIEALPAAIAAATREDRA